MWHHWTVTCSTAGIKLLVFLGSQLKKSYSAKQIKKLIENNCCQVNGQTERFASTWLGNADQVALLIKKLPREQHLKFDLSAVLYEDKDLLIYNKPAAINCDESGIVKLLSAYQQNLLLMHRLDRDTTGALLLVKNQATYNYFLEQFRQLKVKKKYQAIVDKKVVETKGRIDNQLGKKQTFSGQSIWGAVPKGKRAITHWQLVKRGKNASLLHCFPITGRTHQLRVHLAEIGHPILGDHQYCQKFFCTYYPSHYLLHASSLSFAHPITGQPFTIKAERSSEFCQAEQELFS